MLKIIGSILIIIASTGMAVSIQEELKNHLILLYDIRKMLLDIANEAAYSMEPMELILLYSVRCRDKRLEKICRETGLVLERKEQAFGSEIWKNSIEESQKALRLSGEEKEILIDAGNGLFGKTLEENRNHMSHSIERLDCVIENRRKEQKEKQRVYQTVSVMSGLILILLLI